MEDDATALIMGTEEKICMIGYNAWCSISICEAKVDSYLHLYFKYMHFLLIKEWHQISERCIEMTQMHNGIVFKHILF
jgi:hypothetical protein